MPSHDILGGKVKVYRRPESAVWQCSAQYDGRRFRMSTKEKSLSLAKELAEDWYLTLQGKLQTGQLVNEHSFSAAAGQFVLEYETITEGQRSAKYIQSHKDRIRLHLMPFFGNKALSQITSGLVQEYRIYRTTSRDKPPSRSQMHHEIVTLRQVLKTAIRHDWLTHLPDISMPYNTAGKVNHRAWFSPDEYKLLYETTRERARLAKGRKYAPARLQLHDYVLFMANTGLRPDEVNRLEYRDVEIVEDKDSGETILLIEVRGKRGVGYCKSTAGAVFPFQRLKKRNVPDPKDLVFPADHKKQFNAVLAQLDLKQDRDGNRRSAYTSGIPIFAFACWRVPISIRFPRIAGPQSK